MSNRYQLIGVPGMDATGRVVTLFDDLVRDALRGAIKAHGTSSE